MTDWKQADLGAERALIACVLLDARTLDLVGTQADEFYDPKHRLIWAAMRALHERQVEPDTVSIETELGPDARAVNNDGYLFQLSLATASATNAAYYAKIVSDYSVLRHTAATLSEVLDMVRSGAGVTRDIPSGPELLTTALTRLAAVGVRVKKTAVTAAEIVDRRAEQIERQANGEEPSATLLTGLTELDDVTHGIPTGVITVIAARTSEYKSGLAMSICEGVAERGNGVLVFSLEDTWMPYSDRLIARFGGISPHGLRSEPAGKIATSLAAARIALHRLGDMWRFDENEIENVEQLCSLIRCNMLYGTVYETRLVVIDYVNLIGSSGRAHRAEEVRHIMRNLQQLARGLEIAVVVCAQVNREETPDGRPTLRMLRESGAIEEYAKLVIMTHDPSRHRPVPVDGIDFNRPGFGHDPSPPPRVHLENLDVLVPKNSQGPIGAFRLRKLLDTIKVVSWRPGPFVRWRRGAGSNRSLANKGDMSATRVVSHVRWRKEDKEEK